MTLVCQSIPLLHLDCFHQNPFHANHSIVHLFRPWCYTGTCPQEYIRFHYNLYSASVPNVTCFKLPRRELLAQ